MTDAYLQNLARQAADGGPGERATWLRARIRAGERCAVPCHRGLDAGWNALCGCQGTGLAPLRVGVELGAYVGDKASRMVVELDDVYYPCDCASHRPTCLKCSGDGWTDKGHPSGLPFAMWARGIARWGKEASVRAALAAVEAWSDRSVHAFGSYPDRFAAINAVHSWLRTTDIEAAEDSCMRAATTQNPAGLLALYVAQMAPQWRAPGERHEHHSLAHVCVEASRLIGEQAARTAIRDTLVVWILEKQE